MKELELDSIERLRKGASSGKLQHILPDILGKCQTSGGVWRFFSHTFPLGGIEVWNSSELWRGEWGGLPDLFFFGEDIFGNQLTLKIGNENVFLWNHESGELVDLLLEPISLIETVMQSGIDWIDFYTPEMLNVAKSKLSDVPESCHLHWTHPLILGGSLTSSNATIIESVSHLKGHASLWRQIKNIPPGTEIVTKPKS